MLDDSIQRTTRLEMLTISEQGKEAQERFALALRAIMVARRDGRITPFVASSRLSYLTTRYDELLDPLQQIAACQAMIETCERAGQ